MDLKAKTHYKEFLPLGTLLHMILEHFRIFLSLLNSVVTFISWLFDPITRSCVAVDGSTVCVVFDALGGASGVMMSYKRFPFLSGLLILVFEIKWNFFTKVLGYGFTCRLSDSFQD